MNNIVEGSVVEKKECQWLYIIATTCDFNKVDLDRIINVLHAPFYRQYFIESSRASSELICFTGIIQGELTDNQLEFLSDEEQKHKWFSWRVV